MKRPSAAPRLAHPRRVEDGIYLPSRCLDHPHVVVRSKSSRRCINVIAAVVVVVVELS